MINITKFRHLIAALIYSVLSTSSAWPLEDVQVSEPITQIKAQTQAGKYDEAFTTLDAYLKTVPAAPKALEAIGQASNIEFRRSMGPAGTDFALMKIRVSEYAKKYLALATPNLADKPNILAWAKILQSAGETDKAVSFSSAAFEADSSLRAEALVVTMAAYQEAIRGKEMADLLMKLRVVWEPGVEPISLTPANFKKVMGRGNFHLAVLAVGVTEGPQKAIEVADHLEGISRQANLPLDFTEYKAKYLWKLGRKEAALDLLKKNAKSSTLEGATKDGVSPEVQLKLLGQKPPRLEVERYIGDYKGLEKYKGKVVVLDFFAHWCLFCKAEFADLKRLYRDLNSQGVEVVGVNGFYGYYGEEKGLTKEQEFARMQNFVADQYKLPWPVIFVDDAKAGKDFGINGIPVVAVIDRKGKIREIHNGYAESTFKLLRHEIEKIVNEK